MMRFRVLTTFQRVINLAILLTIGAILSGCAGIDSVRPAESVVFKEVESVAVLPFTGKNGTIFSHEIESMLISVQDIPGVTYTVYSRADIPELLEEINFQHSGLTPTQQAIELGNFIGVQTIMIGDVETTSHDDRYTKTIQECVERKNFFKCKKTRPRTINCLRTSVNVRVIPRMVDVKTGAQIYSKVVTGSASRESCSGGTNYISNDPNQEARDQALRSIRRDVAPYHPTFLEQIFSSSKPAP
jgi:hypothetical protein